MTHKKARLRAFFALKFPAAFTDVAGCDYVLSVTCQLANSIQMGAM